MNWIVRTLAAAAALRGRFGVLLLAVAAGLLAAGCRLTGSGGTTFSIIALPSQPAEITLAQGQSGTVTVSFSVSFRNPDGQNNRVACRPPVGVPGGLLVTLRDCPDLPLGGRDADLTVSWIVELSAVTVAPGRYELLVPAQLCVEIADDPSIGRDGSCSLATAVVRVVIADTPAVPDGWQALGDALNLAQPAVTEGPAMVVDGAGRPVVAWVENGRPVVRRHDGTTWQTLAAGLDSLTAQGRPALTLLPPNDTPVLAWTEARVAPSRAAEPTQILLRTWNGSQWVPLAGFPAEDMLVQSSRTPALAVQDGTLFVAWAEQRDTEPAWRIRVLSNSDAANWNDGGDIAPADIGEPSRLALAMFPSGRRYLAWLDTTGSRIRVRELARAGGSSSEIGQFPALNVGEFALLAAPTHGLLLAVPPSPPTAQFSVRRWDGTAWSDYGRAHALVGTGAFVIDVALGVEPGSSAPLLAWSQATTSQRLFLVRRWNGADWADLGGGLTPMGRTRPGQNFRVAVAGGARPFIAMETNQGAAGPPDYAIRVSEFR